MRIGFLVPTIFALDTPGNGVRRQALHQAEALRSLGHDVILMDPWQVYELDSFDVVQFFQGGFATTGIEEVRLPHGVLVWASMIDSNETNKRYRMAARVGELHPRIHTVPGALRRQAARCDLVIVRSAHERARVLDGLGVDAQRVRIVLNGVNPPPAADKTRGSQLTGWAEPFALHVSAYTQDRKNVLNLVRAVGPTGIRLAIAGTAVPGAVLEQLQQLADRYPNVKLLGYLSESDRNALYAACRVFCLPSIHEGTGLVALEAAAWGAEVVITRHGGPPDYFGPLAHYVDPDDVESIRTAVRAAFALPPRGELREHVLHHLTWEQSARSLVDAYRDALSRRRGESAP